MLNKIKEFFLGKPKAVEPEAPYKVEAPSTNWPFPKASEIAPEPAPLVATAPAKKPRAPAKPKAAPAVKPAVAAKKPRVRKPPAN
jgi:hypothetical protein